MTSCKFVIVVDKALINTLGFVRVMDQLAVGIASKSPAKLRSALCPKAEG